MVISGIEGEYTGEVEIKSDLPQGRGIFRSLGKIVLMGYFERGELAEGKFLKIDMQTLSFSICYFWRSESG